MLTYLMETASLCVSVCLAETQGCEGVKQGRAGAGEIDPDVTYL